MARTLSLLVAALAILSVAVAHAQPTAEVLGGRAGGMGLVTATLRDAWSTFHNPAGLAGVEGKQLALAYTNRYDVEEFRTAALSFAWQMPKWSAGVGVSRFGDRLFSEQRLVFSAASHLSGVDIGIRVGYMQLATQGLETRGLPFIDFGVITQLTENLRLGASLHHVNQPRVSVFEDERLAPLVRAGLHYQPVPRFSLRLETEKETSQPLSFRSGIEYEWFTHFFVRTGLSSFPNKAYFGLGGQWKTIQFDYAFNTHPRLGLTHQLSFFYILMRQKIPERHEE